MLWICEKLRVKKENYIFRDHFSSQQMMAATEISIPTLTGSTNYELLKLESQAWTFVIEMSKEKQEEAVALSLPEDDLWNKNEKYFVNWIWMYKTVETV